MSMQQPLVSVKGNKTTPADDRTAAFDAAFKGKNIAQQVLKASEKNVGVASSYNDDDSESSCEDVDFVLEDEI